MFLTITKDDVDIIENDRKETDIVENNWSAIVDNAWLANQLLSTTTD